MSLSIENLIRKSDTDGKHELTKKKHKEAAMNRPITVHNTYQKRRETRSCTTQTCTTIKNAKTTGIRYKLNRQQLLWLCILLSRFMYSTHLKIMEQGKQARTITNSLDSNSYECVS